MSRRYSIAVRESDQLRTGFKALRFGFYRLTRADGREHAGQNEDIQQDDTGFPLVTASHPNDPQALQNYTELFSYDGTGNIQEMKHVVSTGPGGWTRRYEIDPTSNRLLSTSLAWSHPRGRRTRRSTGTTRTGT